MARFKPLHKGLKLLPVDFDRQVIPGSFEYALCHLVDSALDLSAFHATLQEWRRRRIGLRPGLPRRFDVKAGVQQPARKSQGGWSVEVVLHDA